MDIGTYAAASLGIVQLRKLEIQNNNLANVNTVGFKRQVLVTSPENFDDTFAKQLQGKDPYAPGDQDRVSTVNEVSTHTDFSMGAIKSTGNPLDVALRNPNDFFVVNTPQGRTYTRAGNFSLDGTGTIVTQDGMQVMGDGGPIVAQGAGVNITSDGTVRAGGFVVGRLQVVRFPETKGLQPTEGARFKIVSGPQPAPVDGYMEPRALEMSNVSAVTGMIDLITTNRAFDAYTKAAQTIDSLNQAAITQVGRRQ
ncbi:MAG: flagellar basal body rod protein FlgF [Pseudomonadota bacterium]|jgi:flagellar basal-body rod protein FlgG